MLELSDGAQVVIPPGALTKDGEVSLSQSDALPPGGGGLDSLPHQAYEISAPSHTQEVSATVTLPYQGLPMGDALAPDAVFAASWDGRRWELLDGEVDPVKKTLSFETNQASTLSIFAAPAPDALRNVLLPPFFRSCSDWLGGSNPEYPQEPRLSQLTAGLAASNTGAPASPVYRADGYGNSAAYDKVLLADIEGYDSLLAWLPQDKRDLLLAPILAHELAHVGQGDSKFTVAAEVLAKTIGGSLIDEALSQTLRNFYKMILSIGQHDCKATFESSNAFLTDISTGALSCAGWHAREIAADQDGVAWAAKYATDQGIGTALEVGLIYAAFFERIDTPSYCSPPAAKLRADQTIAILKMGQEGGVYGKVGPAAVAGGEVRIDNKVVGKLDDAGQFLVTSIAPGAHTLGFIAPGYQSVSLKVNVPAQRLLEAPPIVLEVAPPTARPTAAPKATAAPSRPGLISDFENSGTWKRGDEAWGSFAYSQEQVNAGKYSGKITYNFPVVANNYLVFQRTLPIAGEPRSLKIMVFGDGSNNFLNAWVKDAKGQVWQYTFGRIAHTGWQEMVAPLDLSLGWPNGPVGSSTSASPTYPLKFQALVLDGWRDDATMQGAVYLDELFAGDAAPIPTPQPQPASASPCEAIPGESYGSLAVQGPPSDRPAEAHADLNLAVRGYQRNNAPLQFSDYGPAADPNGPQLPGLFGDQRVPTFTSSYQVFDWDWGCNCRGGLLTTWETTLLGMGVSPGEPLRVPDSARAIGDGYEVLVLYASPDRITLKYTPEDNAVRGHTLHVEGVCVEPDLLGLYQSLNASGRGQLPALRAGQAFGRAKAGEILVAIRGGGAFFDPRSRQDWWRGK